MNNNSDTYLEKNKKKQKKYISKNKCIFFWTKKEQRVYTFLHDVEKIEAKSHICDFL